VIDRGGEFRRERHDEDVRVAHHRQVRQMGAADNARPARG
jgi:hypothetical protein